MNYESVCTYIFLVKNIYLYFLFKTCIFLRHFLTHVTTLNPDNLALASYLDVWI